MTNYYFAYGSNMTESQIMFRCPDSTFIGITKLINKSFYIDARGVASIKNKPESHVYGAVWTLSHNGLCNLDTHEGYPSLYIKNYYNVLVNDKLLNVLVYESTTLESGIPRVGYLEKIIQSAQKLNFSDDYISELSIWLNQE